MNEFSSPDSPLAAARTRIADLLTRRLEGELELLDEIRDAVRQFVRLGKAERMPSERVLSALKSALQEAIRPNTTRGELNELTDQVVKWCIGEYYTNGPASPDTGPSARP
jgi:hypothetical protein